MALKEMETNDGQKDECGHVGQKDECGYVGRESIVLKETDEATVEEKNECRHVGEEEKRIVLQEFLDRESKDSVYRDHFQEFIELCGPITKKRLENSFKEELRNSRKKRQETFERQEKSGRHGRQHF